MGHQEAVLYVLMSFVISQLTHSKSSVFGRWPYNNLIASEKEFTTQMRIRDSTQCEGYGEINSDGDSFVGFIAVFCSDGTTVYVKF